jgi:hypothetical protein
MAAAHGLFGHFAHKIRAVEIREALAEVDGPVLAGQSRHFAENSNTNRGNAFRKHK